MVENWSNHYLPPQMIQVKRMHASTRFALFQPPNFSKRNEERGANTKAPNPLPQTAIPENSNKY